MYFNSYGLEIKNRILLLVLTWSSFVFVSYYFKEILISLVVNNCYMKLFSFLFTDVLEVFSAYVHLIFFFSNQVFMVYFFYHILLFFLPSLTRLEASFLVLIFVLSNFLFFFSVLVFQEFLFPMSWNFFLSFRNFDILKSIQLNFDAKLFEYILFYTKFYKMCILYFQIFIIPIFVFQYIKNELTKYSRFRKLLYYFCVAFSTAITPPDVFSQVILSLSTIFCCEILIYSFAIKKALNF